MIAVPTPSGTIADLEAVEMLADPLRRQIVQLLVDEELCTCHLVDMTGAAQPTVSYHLKVLREAGWVRAEPEGRYTYYVLQPQPLSLLAEQLSDLAGRTVSGHARRPTCEEPPP